MRETQESSVSESGQRLLTYRIVASIVILVTGAWCAWQQSRLLQGLEIVENMIVGGRSAAPRLMQTALDNEFWLIPLVAFCALVSLAFIWLAGRRIPKVVYAAVAGVAPALLTGLFFEIAFNTAVHEVATR